MDGKNALISVVVITRHRPHLVADCLRHVFAQDYRPFEVVVVDASDDDATEQVMASYSQACYVHLRGAVHQIPHSRNEGILRARGDIIAFVDDDSIVQPGWMRNLVADYSSPQIGGVGGLVLAPEQTARLGGAIPRITQTGSVVGDFDVMTASPVEVDHLRGCNMSFRREALEKVGGFDTLLDQSNFRDETDVCVGVRHAGFKLIYDPRVAVQHLYSAKEGFERDEWKDRKHYYSIVKNSAYFRLKHFLRLKTLIAVFIGGPALALIRNARRQGARGFLLTWTDWMGRAAGGYTFLKSRSRHGRA